MKKDIYKKKMSVIDIDTTLPVSSCKSEISTS